MPPGWRRQERMRCQEDPAEAVPTAASWAVRATLSFEIARALCGDKRSLRPRILGGRTVRSKMPEMHQLLLTGDTNVFTFAQQQLVTLFLN